MGIGVVRRIKDSLCCFFFNDFSSMHYKHVISDVVHYAEVVIDKKIGQVELVV